MKEKDIHGEYVMKKNIVAFTMSLVCIVVFSLGCATCDCQPTPNTQPLETVAPCPPCKGAIPQTNAEIRLWYNHQVVIIPTLNTGWINEGVSAKERAQRAYDIRHRARIYARLLMQDKEEVDMLRKRDMEKYGNPEGPTWLYLIEKNRQKGLTDDKLYEEIVKSSSRTSAEYNTRFGIEQ